MREAVVPYDCADCGHDATAAFGELLLHGRLHWSLSHSCAAGPIEACGRDESPTGLRQALLDQCGTYHLRLLAGDRVPVMKVLRNRGTPLRDIPAAVAALRDPRTAGHRGGTAPAGHPPHRDRRNRAVGAGRLSVIGLVGGVAVLKALPDPRIRGRPARRGFGSVRLAGVSGRWGWPGISTLAACSSRR